MPLPNIWADRFRNAAMAVDRSQRERLVVLAAADLHAHLEAAVEQRDAFARENDALRRALAARRYT